MDQLGIQNAITIGEEWLGVDHPAVACLRIGMAVHHGGLPSPFLREIERLLATGAIQVTAASPTLAQGLNLNAAVLLTPYIVRSGSTISGEEFANEALMGATVTSCMIAFILTGAAFLSVAMGFTGIPRNLAAWIGTFELSPYALLAALTVFFIILGCFLDGISVVVLTTSIVMPMVEGVGINPLWFGIYLVIVVEMSQITPPVGFNLFVIQGLTGINILRIAKAALPFFLMLLLAVVLITAFPQIATYLPNLMNN